MSGNLEKIRIPRGENQQEVKVFEEVPSKETDSPDEGSEDEFRRFRSNFKIREIFLSALKDKLLRDGPMAVFNAEDGVALRAKRQMG